MSHSYPRGLIFEDVNGAYATWMTWRRADGSVGRRLVTFREACAFATAYERALGAVVDYMESTGKMPPRLNVDALVSNVDTMTERQ